MNRVNAEPEHLPVMVEETLQCLAPQPGETMLDGTLGLGGHAVEIFRALMPGGTLVGIDRDPQALERASARLDGVGGEYRLLHGTFDAMGQLLQEAGLGVIMKIADIGGQDQIGGRIGALGAQSLDHAFFEIHHAHLDTGFLGKGIQKRVHQKRLTFGIQINLLGVGRGDCRDQGGSNS